MSSQRRTLGSKLGMVLALAADQSPPSQERDLSGCSLDPRHRGDDADVPHGRRGGCPFHYVIGCSGCLKQGCRSPRVFLRRRLVFGLGLGSGRRISGGRFLEGGGSWRVGLSHERGFLPRCS